MRDVSLTVTITSLWWRTLQHRLLSKQGHCLLWLGTFFYACWRRCLSLGNVAETK